MLAAVHNVGSPQFPEFSESLGKGRNVQANLTLRMWPSSGCAGTGERTPHILFVLF